jgi:hypothetical protein
VAALVFVFTPSVEKMFLIKNSLYLTLCVKRRKHKDEILWVAILSLFYPLK